MQHTIENEYLKIAVKEQGAELCSLRDQKAGMEYLWQANPAVWGRHAPVLFPIVGKLQDNTYAYKGELYSLSQHGFARDMQWEAEDSGPDSLSFLLQDSAFSLEKYPFPFRLRASYQLAVDSLLVRYEVYNPGSEAMPFSIGAHPGFRCPLQEGEQYEDYYLKFEQAETLDRQLLENGLRNGKTQPVLRQERELPIQPGLFEDDALVFEGMKSGWVALHSKNHAHGLKFYFEGFPYLGIWTKPGNREFICIEPWYGVADKVGGTQDILQKEGIQLLSAKETFSCAYRVQLF